MTSVPAFTYLYLINTTTFALLNEIYLVVAHSVLYQVLLFHEPCPALHTHVTFPCWLMVRHLM